jgi:hypothetical protein
VLQLLCDYTAGAVGDDTCCCVAFLMCRFPPPAGIRERIYNFEGVAYAHFEPHAYDGDMRWMENF